MLYNIIHIKLKQKKEKKHERIQVQKADSIAYGRSGSIARFSSDFNDSSINGSIPGNRDEIFIFFVMLNNSDANLLKM